MGIDVGKFLKAPEYDIRITTYRDIFQVEALEQDRFGEEYKKLSAAVMMGKSDMEKMGFKAGDRVRLTNNNGSIVVEVRATRRDEPGGIAFMVNSPWSNLLVSSDAGDNGIPEFKNIIARISLTKEEITPLEKLMGL
ncbi:molybdopterin dinucleotide binding domain-containing protein [Candidatus Methanoperedens nitratireducens]|uniref:Molybdopterin dinucleotide-binding region n=1 Tax=Candidatus Methanoperedens nitratireducens TaxID=1392998 RepID=A0A284VQ32_9EURY|nr:molybdopterin dinucleotide binding domain-containing protein [Candidatus Methanoperedens nitroreducens]SNQ61391.1 Molybdopterin dinucleotide-binding region [Candidatus Methanoperedens nitroreducens]